MCSAGAGSVCRARTSGRALVPTQGRLMGFPHPSKELGWQSRGGHARVHAAGTTGAQYTSFKIKDVLLFIQDCILPKWPKHILVKIKFEMDSTTKIAKGYLSSDSKCTANNQPCYCTVHTGRVSTSGGSRVTDPCPRNWLEWSCATLGPQPRHRGWQPPVLHRGS